MLTLDIRHAVRQIAGTCSFSAAVIMTLAVGIGSTAAVFAVVYAVLLRPLPYRDAARLVTIWNYNPGNTFSGSRGLGGSRVEPLTAVSPAFLRELATQVGTMEVAGLSPSWPVSVTGNGRPEKIDAAYVSPSLLATLGVQPRLGRDFSAAEHVMGGPRAAIVSDALWRARYADRPTIRDETIAIDGERHAIVGVMPAGVSLPNTSAEVWLPFSLNPFYTRADIPIVFVIGRLKSGVSRGDAERELDRASRVLQPQLRVLRGEALRLITLRDRMAAGSRTIALVLFGAVAVLTLIGCVNVSNLLLSRHAARAHEIAMRNALGASRARIVRQLLIESTIFGLAGGAAGLFVAWLLIGPLRAWLASSLPVNVPISIDPRVIAFSAAASLLASVVFGTAPAWLASRRDVMTALRGTPRSVAGSDTRIRALLIAGEVALALVLVSGATLLARSLVTLSSVNPGFRIERIATGEIDLPETRYPEPADRAAFVRRLDERLAATPGITSAGFVNRLPLGGAPNNLIPIDAEGFAPASGRPEVVDRRVATPRYFATIGMPLLSGRAFMPLDDTGAPLVAIVNATMAHLVWQESDPIGRRVRIRFPTRLGPWLTVVGVVADVHHTGLDTSPRPELYVPYAQAPVESVAAVAASGGGAEPLAEILRKTIWSIDPELPVSNARTMREVVAQAVAEPRSRTLLLSTVALVALILSIVGIASVVAYSAAGMRRDLGIRMALGATRRDVRRLLATRVLAPVLAGAAAGIALSFVTTRVLRAFLFQIEPSDPLSLLMAAGTVGLCAWVGATFPAWRASRTDPVSLLRE